MVAPRALSGHRVIGLDTTVFIYALEAHPTFDTAARRILHSVETAQTRAVASTLVLAELLVLPFREGRPDAAERYVRALEAYPNLQLAAPDAETCVVAAELRARYRSLRMADAVHIATALRAGATAFATNDSDLPTDLPIHLIQLASLVGDTEVER